VVAWRGVVCDVCVCVRVCMFLCSLLAETVTTVDVSLSCPRKCYVCIIYVCILHWLLFLHSAVSPIRVDEIYNLTY
jgi:hypothetical protein